MLPVQNIGIVNKFKIEIIELHSKYTGMTGSVLHNTISVLYRRSHFLSSCHLLFHLSRSFQLPGLFKR